LQEIQRQISVLRIVFTIQLPHWGPNAPAARSLNLVGWPLRSLAGWLVLEFSGCHNPIAGSFTLVGWPSGSLAGCLTLQPSGYRCPMVGIPFTAVLSHAVLIHHFCPDGHVNLVQNYRLYPVWAIGPRLRLPGKKVFSI